MSNLKTSGDPPATPDLNAAANPDVADFRAAFDLLLANQTIKLSGLQRRLLGYLGNKSLDGQADQLKEYVIGLEAFGKSPQYNPQEDSSVRVQAARLRQRLDEYFEHEGSTEPIVVRLQKGCFRVTFERRQVAPPPPAPLATGSHRDSGSTSLRRLPLHNC